jgi:hypothetical protein
VSGAARRRWPSEDGFTTAADAISLTCSTDHASCGCCVTGSAPAGVGRPVFPVLYATPIPPGHRPGPPRAQSQPASLTDRHRSWGFVRLCANGGDEASGQDDRDWFHCSR